MKAILSVVALVLSVRSVAPTISTENSSLPELHKINRVTLSPSYSCRSAEDFRKGYENTALFLSAYSQRMNSPELLFNGACGSADSFEAATAGDDLDVVADYGEWPIEDLTAQQVFSPRRLAGAYAQFSQSVPVLEGHTYGLLINKPEVRGFFFFQVMRYVPNQKVELKYVVQDYQLLNRSAASPGFAWDQKSYY
ncbi:MAG TPA: hypothetical protein VJV96_07250 [Candidatus Angelobacter sp.]|jgi:hypothetical protein|nr:hypothetical protein [Candidatus Angelobacter sp.]